MKKKLNCVLLVDDDDATNYIHKFIINEINFAEHIKIVENGQEALNYLKSKNDRDYRRPNLIFLDVNMPQMDGWEFLEHYKRLDEELIDKMMVVMLTTSLNPDDKANAETIGYIDRYMTKPLNAKMLRELLLQYTALGF